MSGRSLQEVQELLGHATIDMTQRYAHLSPEAKRDAVRRARLPCMPAILFGSKFRPVPPRSASQCRFCY